MTLIEIAEAIDAQIERMSQIRAVVSTLLPAQTELSVAVANHDAALTIDRLSEPDAHTPEKSRLLSPPPKRTPRKVPVAKPRSAPAVHQLSARASVPPTALGGVVPERPVFVAAADVVRSRIATETPSHSQNAAIPRHPGHSLDDLVRQLSHRSA